MSGRKHPPVTAVVTVLAFAGPALSYTTLAAGSTASTPTAAASSIAVMDEVLVTSVREKRVGKGATNLPLSIADTPQSVTLLEQELIEAFTLDSVNDALKMVTGVNVEEVETDRTYYNARGFDIKSMQVDGMGLPFTWNVAGKLDTVVYEKIEVVRGANGLLTGTGNPSGTINFVRKRPTNKLKASTELTAGSWDKNRIEVDVSGPLTESRLWAGRVVAAGQEAESYLDLNETDRNVFYGIVDGQIGDNAILTLGFTRQNSNAEGVMWGALPLLYNDGTQTDFDVDSTTSQDWTYWNIRNETRFIELAYTLSPDWEFKTALTHNDFQEHTALFYVISSDPVTGEDSFDRGTGLGLHGYPPSKYFQRSRQMMLDATLTGKFDLFDRNHSLVLGFSKSHSDNSYLDYPAADSDYIAMPVFSGWSGNEVPEPEFEEPFVAADWTNDLRRFYGALDLEIADPLNLIVGFNAIDVKSEGVSFDAPMNRDEDKVSPYIGVLYHINDSINAYASYSNIFEPLTELASNGLPLPAAEGKSYEAGIKAELVEKRVLATAAVFKAKQEGYPEYAGYDVENNFSYYEGFDVDSHGYELEVSGFITEQWAILSGFSHLTVEDSDGNDARTFVPRETFKLGTRYRLPAVKGLEIGGTLRWQESIRIDTDAGTIRQDAYSLLSAYVAYAFDQHWKVQANAYNLTDEKYLSSLYWDQAFYGAPVNYAASIKYLY